MSVTEHVPVTREERRYLDFRDPADGLYLGVTLITLVDKRPISAGYSNVHCAHFEGNPDDKVAVKCPLYSSDEEQNKLMDQALEKEITVLKRVRHPNILPFLGLVRYGEWNDLCIITPWMKNGSLRQYLDIHPDADRLEILTDVAIAVDYLHSGAGLPQTLFMIHGDIHAGNVLISDEGKGLLADFGLSKRVLVNEQTSISLRPVGGPPGVYIAPELRDLPDAPRSRCSDVFAFGMLIYETYAGVRPNVPVDKSGQRPERASISRSDMTDAVWKVACHCWAHSPSDRPSMQNVIAKLRQAPGHAIARHTTPEDTGPVPSDDKLYLAHKYNPIPKLRTVGGSFGDVRICRQAGKPDVLVAIKFARYSEDEETNMRKERALEKEIMYLKLCQHPNILEYLGLTRDEAFGGVGIVYPYAAERSLPTHLKANKYADRYQLMREVAAGLKYLHLPTPAVVIDGESVHFVHGNIHPGNVLVMGDGRAVLSDFGLSKIARLGHPTSMSGGVDGVPEYTAPEVYKLEDIQLPAGVRPLVKQHPEYAGLRTVKCDVFAFGMLVFTTFWGDVRPALRPAIAAALVEGKRPRREHVLPEEAENNGRNGKQLDDDTWALICDCWKPQAGDRPTMEEVCKRLGVV